MWNATELLPEQYESYLTDMSTELKRELGFVIPYADSPYDHENVGEEGLLPYFKSCQEICAYYDAII